MTRKSAPKRKRVQPVPQPAPSSEQRAPEWVKSMHEYYHQTGLYRAGDLNRVLGDPRDQLIGEPNDGLLVACGIPKK
jgi:hypothetical protein